MPMTLPIVKDDEVLAKAFCITAIIIRPEIINSWNGKVPTVSTLWPIARLNTAKNSKDVTTGIIKVWL